MHKRWTALQLRYSPRNITIITINWIESMNKRYIIPLLLAFMARITVMAVPYCDVRKFSITDGLAANTISDIKQSPDKLIWFATWNGLSYYDG